MAGAEGTALGVSTIGSVGPLQSANKGHARRFSPQPETLQSGYTKRGAPEGCSGRCVSRPKYALRASIGRTAGSQTAAHQTVCDIRPQSNSDARTRSQAPRLLHLRLRAEVFGARPSTASSAGSHAISYSGRRAPHFAGYELRRRSAPQVPCCREADMVPTSRPVRRVSGLCRDAGQDTGSLLGRRSGTSILSNRKAAPNLDVRS